MTYTIRGARWGSPEHTSAVVLSEEVGHVAISAMDAPEEWAAFLEWAKSNPVGDSPTKPLLEPKKSRLELLEERVAALEVRS